MKVYAHLVEPEEYLGYDAKTSKVVTHDALGHQVRFTGLKFLSTDSTGRLSNFKQDIDIVVNQLQLCDCLWVNWSTLNADNLPELIAYIHEKGLYFGGFWGFVPGSKADVTQKHFWGEFAVPEEIHNLLCETLGDRFLGYESGEQDGRYVGSYALRSSAIGNSHYNGYCEFQRFCEKINDSLHNQMSFLSSLNLVHYQAKEGNLVMLGTETAHSLLNSQVGYAFVRGASRQYGVLTLGNISAWNRWGYKTYDSGAAFNKGFECGPTKGASVSLMRRLLYQQYFYNCDLLGFAQSWLYGDDNEKRIAGKMSEIDYSRGSDLLTPLGIVQQQVKRFAGEHGKLGTFYAPIALMLDFYAGWVPPRHLYSSYIYKTWGSLPYRDGDYQTHALFSLLYPCYENAGWYKDESGFLSATPLGDMTDVLLSDARPAVLDQYRVLILTNTVQWSYEFYRNMLRYVRKGGHVIVCAGGLLKAYDRLHDKVPDFWQSFGLRSLGERIILDDRQVTYQSRRYEQNGLGVYTCELLPDTDVIASADIPVIVSSQNGEGQISVILSDSGLQAWDTEFIPYNLPNEDIVQPYVFTPCVEQYLSDVYRAYHLAKPDNVQLQYAVSVENDKQIVLQVTNNTHLMQAFDIVSPFSVDRTERLLLTDDVANCEGYYPENVKTNNDVINGRGVHTLAAGDTVFYRIFFTESEMELMPKTRQRRAVDNLYIKMLPGQNTLRDFVMSHPTFGETFTGVLVDAAYFIRHDADFLAEEAKFLSQRKVRVIVDCLPILNHYPQISFLRSFPDRYCESMECMGRLLKKIRSFDCTALLVGAMKDSEMYGNINGLKTDLLATFQTMQKQTTTPLLFQNRPIMFSINEAYELARQVDGIQLSLDMSAAMCVSAVPQDLVRQYGIRSLSISAPGADQYGQYYDAHMPVAPSGHAEKIREQMRAVLDRTTDAVVMSANYADWDEVMQDYDFLFGDLEEQQNTESEE